MSVLNIHEILMNETKSMANNNDDNIEKRGLIVYHE
jgi:hypothetical protein